MATGFSVFVNIGGKVSPSLNAAVNAAKAQVNGLAASLAGVAARINAPFLAVNKHLAETSKRLATVQRHGRNASLGVTMPAAWLGGRMLKESSDFVKKGNMMEALGELPKDKRKEFDHLAMGLAKRYDAGGSSGILDTMTELLKAGFTPDQTKGVVEQVLAGSAMAGDMTPADVGSSLSKTMTQFAMPAKTYEQAMTSATEVTDKMVYAAVSTVASMKDVAETLKYAGSIAAVTGNSLNSVTAMTMAFAKAGVLGSEAGVALRSAIVRLVKMPKGGMKALARIGMNLGDYTHARPVTADSVVQGLQADGIDASKVKGQIAKVIANRGKKDPTAVTAEITKLVQGAVGSTSAVDSAQIAKSVNESYSAAGTKVDITKFMKDLKAKIDKGVATTGDIAQILEARHISRYMALLRADLTAMEKEVDEKSAGYAKERYNVAFQGLPAALTLLSGSWEEFRNTVVESVAGDISAFFDKISASMKSLSDSNPKLLRTGLYLAAAAMAAGPLLFVLGAVGRLGVFALRGLNFALMALLMPIGLIGRLLSGVVLAGVAGFARLAAGLRAMVLLSAIGGTGATLGAMAAGLGRLGLAVLMFPLTALRAIGVGMMALALNPVGLIIGGLVLGLTALGVWVANNWEGVKSFFSAFGTSFMEGIGGANGPLGTLAGYLKSAYDSISQMLGPLNQTTEGWRSWGAAVGGAAASGINAVVDAIQRVIGFFGTAIQKAQEFGRAVANMVGLGGGGAAAPAGGAAPAAPVAGKRALGGPVTFGRPYLVGERGPELFVPGMSGRIETNNTLRRMTADGTTVAAGGSSGHVVSNTVHAPISIHVAGNGDPDAIARETEVAVHRVLAQLESEQRGLLSD